jgi:hypothetical protein
MNRTLTVHRIEPTSEARDRLEAYFNQVVARRKAGDLSDVSQYASRWCEQAARLAITLHAGLHGAEAHRHPLVLETADSAVRLAEWFADQQLNLLAKGRHAAAEKVETAVLELLEANRERKGLDYVTARDLHRARIVSTADAARALLARMEGERLLTGDDVRPAQGGKATRIYRAIGGIPPVPGLPG